MNCTSCRYSQIDQGDPDDYQDGPLMRCHRYPPVVLTIDGVPAQTWPNVGPDDWCGEYRSDRQRVVPGPVDIVTITDPGSGRPTRFPPLGPTLPGDRRRW